MNYEELYLKLYIMLWLAMALFAVLMIFMSLRKRNSPDAGHANILPLLSIIPDDEKAGGLKDLQEEKNDTLSDT